MKPADATQMRATNVRQRTVADVIIIVLYNYFPSWAIRHDINIFQFIQDVLYNFINSNLPWECLYFPRFHYFIYVLT
jgi:hypothetical protein